MRRTLILSHRGESDDALANTIVAFQLAMERDSDGVELDIRRSADGQLVVCHDGNLLRIANNELEIEKSTVAEIQRVYPVPLLTEVLPLILPGKVLQIELKGATLLSADLKKVLDNAMVDRETLFISSFEITQLIDAASFFPDLPRILLIDLEKDGKTFPTAAEVMAMLRQIHATGVSFRATFSATDEFVGELRASGVRVVGWGVKTDELGKHLIKIGVDQFTCNHAVALRSLAYPQR